MTSFTSSLWDAPWKPAESPLLTQFARDVSPSTLAATTPYPRPQLRRSNDTWTSLNGLWEFDWQPPHLQDPPFGRTLNHSILVPFPVESPLSGLRQNSKHDYMWYRKVVDASFWSCMEGRTWLNMEASDWNTTVYVNGELVMGPNNTPHHIGAFDPFVLDVSPYWFHNTSSTELIIGVYDPTEQGTANGVGKQNSQRLEDPSGIFYTSTSGIWGTVWLECVPEPISIHSLAMETSHPDTQGIVIHAHIHNHEEQMDSPYFLRAFLLEDQRKAKGQEIILDTCKRDVSLFSNQSTTIIFPPPSQGFRYWSPDHPYLYGLRIQVVHSNTLEIIDEVKSYVGVRTVEISSHNLPDLKMATTASSSSSSSHLSLNGHPTFQMAVLDQGFSPDGNYVYANEEALLYDLTMTKQMGFNTIRKHMKMESRRWYYHADRLGLLVWQDLPSRRTQANETGWDSWVEEMTMAIQARQNAPSIIQWTAFNEGWAQNYDNTNSEQNHSLQKLQDQTNTITQQTVQKLQTLDPTRLITDASGGRNVCHQKPLDDYHFWAGGCFGNNTDFHTYCEPDQLLDGLHHVAMDSDPNKAFVLGEYGGILLIHQNHEWYPSRSHGQNKVDTQTQLQDKYDQYAYKIQQAIDHLGLSAAVYTQLTDVETECNGLLTYDRLLKIDIQRIHAINTRVIRHFERRQYSSSMTE